MTSLKKKSLTDIAAQNPIKRPSGFISIVQGLSALTDLSKISDLAHGSTILGGVAHAPTSNQAFVNTAALSIVSRYAASGELMKEPIIDALKDLVGKEIVTNGNNPFKFQIGSILGIGGFGAVIKVMQIDPKPDHDLPMVMKVQFPGGKDEIQRKYLFKNELNVLKSIKEFDHANLTKFFNEVNFSIKLGKRDVPLEGIVLEYVNGKTLLQIIEDKHTLSWNYLKETVLPGVLSGLNALHNPGKGQGIVYEDLSLGNILIGEKFNGSQSVPRPVLIDFASAEGIGKSRSITMGTPGYLAPEKIPPSIGPSEIPRAELHTSKSDIFSLGMTLYECLSGENPFLVRQNENAMDKIFNSKLESLDVVMNRKRLAPIPNGLSDLIMRMVEKNFNKRPSIEEVISEFEKYGVVVPKTENVKEIINGGNSDEVQKLKSEVATKYSFVPTKSPSRIGSAIKTFASITILSAVVYFGATHITRSDLKKAQTIANTVASDLRKDAPGAINSAKKIIESSAAKLDHKLPVVFNLDVEIDGKKYKKDEIVYLENVGTSNKKIEYKIKNKKRVTSKSISYTTNQISGGLAYSFQIGKTPTTVPYSSSMKPFKITLN